MAENIIIISLLEDKRLLTPVLYTYIFILCIYIVEVQNKIKNKNIFIDLLNN